MALDPRVIASTTATVAVAGTSVNPVLAVPDNCHTVIVFNTEALLGDTLYVAVGTAPAAIAAGTALQIKPQERVTLEIGIASKRPTGAANLIYDGTGTVVASISYLNEKTM